MSKYSSAKKARLMVVLFFLFFENGHESLQSFREVFVFFVYREFYSCFNASDVEVAEEKEDGEA